MTVSQKTASPSATARLIHRSLVSGVVLFALVSHFLLKPTTASSGLVSVYGVRVLVAVSLVAGIVSLLLRGRVPKRSTDESADLFWTKAGPPALLAWAPLEAASLFGVVVYGITGSVAAIAIVAVVMLLFLGLNPAFLEKR